MHYHLEIITPPTKDVLSVVEKILEPFCENRADLDGPPAFWDFYVIGGRWAGEKIRARYSEEALQAFYDELSSKEITVSGITAGKQEIDPPSQIAVVDEIWRKHFPGEAEVCPLFKHYNDQYAHSTGYPDVCSLKDVPLGLYASRVIIAGPSNEATFMIEDQIWNGVTHVDSSWDGRVLSAIEIFEKKIKNYAEAYVAENTPKDDWLCVTVDYHS